MDSAAPTVLPVAPAAVQARPLPAQAILTAPRLSVVIVNYHQWESTASLAKQIVATPSARQGQIEVVVVDNHSTRHKQIPQLRRLDGVSLRRWKHNNGYSRAANEGCRLSQGDWVLLLNPDMTLPAGFLDHALALTEQLEIDDPKTGVVGFQLHNTDGTPQLSSGPWPSLAGTLMRLVLPRSRRKYSALPANGRCRVPWVTGCCFLLRRECLQQVGGFDESFFLYYEDVDFCQRAARQGWSVCFEPGLAAVHHHPLHSRDVPHHIRLITRHALLTYAQKYWPRWQWQTLAFIVGWEARFRRGWARWRQDAQAGKSFRELSHIVQDLSDGRHQQARRRLHGIVREHGRG